MLRILTDGKLTNSAYECGILAAKATLMFVRNIDYERNTTHAGLGTVFITGYVKSNNMNNSVKIHTLFIACAISLSACNNSETTIESRADSTSTEIKNDVLELTHDVKDAMNGNQDSNFVVKAALNNMADIKVLQAGLDNGTSMELKRHARMMMADHKKMATDVKAYAEKKGYLLPATDEGRGDEEIKELANNSKGADWDKGWLDNMDEAHEDLINMFEKGNNNVNDADLKTWIQSTLPTIRAHEDMIKGMKDKLN